MIGGRDTDLLEEDPLLMVLPRLILTSQAIAMEVRMLDRYQIGPIEAGMVTGIRMTRAGGGVGVQLIICRRTAFVKGKGKFTGVEGKLRYSAVYLMDFVGMDEATMILTSGLCLDGKSMLTIESSLWWWIGRSWLMHQEWGTRTMRASGIAIGVL